jgi:stage II sporulation protein D
VRWICLLAAVSCAAGQSVRLRVARQTIELPRERYVAGVLGGESSVFRSEEALKAMAVAARTYVVHHRGRHSTDGYDVCATTHCQRVDLDAITARIEAAASATEGELLWREGRPALTLYSLDCGRDPGSVTWTWSAEPGRIVQALARSELRAPADLRSIAIVQRNPSGRAQTLALAGSTTVRIAAESFRLAIGRELGWNSIRSDLYEVEGLLFRGRGAGHGEGLCQRGADRMGVDGRSYREILESFYPGTKLGATARGISWQRMCGSTVCVESVDGRRDVLAAAERIAARLPWPVSGVVVRVYPDVETFRDATGAPGWIAGYTSGRRVHLQPLRGDLERTLRHELLHVAIESQARPGLPVWFHEGLALYLEGGVRGVAAIPKDAELRSTDARTARQAYVQAGRAVAGLVSRYGREAVLDWVKRGLPPEVK